MKKRATGKATFVAVTVLMLAVLIGGFCGGVLYEKENTEPVITFYRTQADSYRQSAEEYREALAETVVELQIAQKEVESYQVALAETKDQLDKVSERLEATQQESADLLSQVENFKQTGYVTFRSETEIREYVKSTGISQRNYVRTTYDCDDFAIDLVVQAYRDKRMIGLWGYPGHLKCFAIKGNYVYGVEPQNNRISILARLD